MASLEDLNRTVAATIASRRIGKPVFVRCLLVGCPRLSNDPSRIEQIVRMLSDWFGEPFEFGALAGSVGTGQDTCCLRSRGALGLVCWASNSAAHERVDLTLLGTRGAIYHSLDLPPPEEDELSERPAQAPLGQRRHGVLLICGNHTHQEDYALAFAADPRCQIIAVTDEANVDIRRRQLNERLAASLGVPYVLDLDEALRDSAVDIVSICAPPERRGRIAVRCAEAGKHLYLDKSLASNLEDARAIVAAVRKAGVHSHMFSSVSANWARPTKRLLQSGALGKLLAIHADTFFAKGHGGTVKHPVVRHEEYPPERHQLVAVKRELDNVGVYPITLVRWLTGRAFASVQAFTANFFFAEHELHDVEDFGILTGTLEDGLPVTVAAGRIGWSSHPAGGVNRLVLVGSERTAIIDANRPRLEVYAAEQPWTPPPAHPQDPMAFWTSTQLESGLQPKRIWLSSEPPSSDVSYFLDRLDAQSESEMSASEAALATEVLLAAYKSAASGAVVHLPLDQG
jgi:myo-inositol 2-dehydrogenase / D-chiro-inositol 1-dehydrogenase